MPDSLSETKACDLLAKLFRARGYTLARNITFREYGVSFHIDGWDAKARVGFEFLSSEDDDHDDLSLAEYQTLMQAQQKGELSLFIIDEVEPLSARDLTMTANAFLDEVEQARRGRRKPARATKKSVKKRPAKASKKAATKTAKKTAKRVAKKSAARTPAAAAKGRGRR